MAAPHQVTNKLVEVTAQLTGLDDPEDVTDFLRQVLDTEPDQVTGYMLSEAIAAVEAAVEAKDAEGIFLWELDEDN